MRWVVFAVLLFGTVAFGQLAQTGPQPAYEGQNVSAVSLIANPHRDLSPLLPLVSQKAGAPYVGTKIQESAAALKQAGGFTDVQVAVEPEVSGLRVNFLLEPAYYVGSVEFSAVGKYFAYSRLLQVVNLPDEEPYDPSRIPLAENALREFLRKNGYFQATVHAEPAIDDDHKLVSVGFTVTMGSRARVSSVNVEGPEAGESARLLHAVRSLRARLSGGLLKPGKPYTPQRMKAASQLMKRTLTRDNRLASSIQENAPLYNASTNRVEVSFKVEVGPIVTVRTVGAPAYEDSVSAGAAVEDAASRFTRREPLIGTWSRKVNGTLPTTFRKRASLTVKVTTRFENNQIRPRGLSDRSGYKAQGGRHCVSG